MSIQPAVVAGKLPPHDLPQANGLPGLVMQAAALAGEHNAAVIVWPRWDMAVITPATLPLGLVAGGLGMLLPPGELVVPPGMAALLADALGRVLATPAAETVAAAQQALAIWPGIGSEQWSTTLAGWAAALAGDWEALEAVLNETLALAERSTMPQGLLAQTAAQIATLALEAGASPDLVWAHAEHAAATFRALGQDVRAGLALWLQAQAALRTNQNQQALALADEALALVQHTPEAHALVLAGVAELHATLIPGRNPLQALHEAVERCPEPTNPLLAARLRSTLGDHLIVKGDDGALHEAIAQFRQAAELFATFGTRADVAATQMSEGSAWHGLGGDVRGNLRRAIDCYQRASQVFTLASHPAEYALIHNNLATAYIAMPMSSERDIMRQALALQSMQEALKVYSIEEYPYEYAMVQNNLGNALQYMPSGDRVEKLDRAIGAYQEALRVRSRARTPIEYATTLSNLANAYANLPAADRDETLALAEQCYREALDVLQERTLLEQAATVRSALENVQRDRANVARMA